VEHNAGICGDLEACHRATLKLLMEHLALVAQQDENKMDSKSLARSIYNVLKGKQTVAIKVMKNFQTVVQHMIEENAEIFNYQGGSDESSL